MIFRNKKGQIEDLLDLFYLVGGTVVILVIASLALGSSIARNNQITLSELGDFNRIDSAINNLKVSTAEGQKIRYEEVDGFIRTSKILRGKTITGCFDYESEEDCSSDPIKVTKSTVTSSCVWFKESCLEVGRGIGVQ